MTPQKFVVWFIGIGGVAFLSLVSVVWSYNTGWNEKQDLKIDQLDERREVSDSDLKLLQYEQRKINEQVGALSHSVGVIDDKLDELVNWKREKMKQEQP